MNITRLCGIGALAVLTTAVARGAGAQAARDADPALAFEHATVIDGTGAPPVAGRTILVDHGVITGIFPSGSRALPAGARIIDLAGQFVIPGLIDAHVHVATDPAGHDANAAATLRLALLGGLTSVRDMAGDDIVLKQLADASRSADAEMPRIYYSSLMAGPSFFGDPRTRSAAHGGTPGDVPWMKAITPATDLAAAVRGAKATGATAIKIYADLPAGLVKKIVAEAHRQGMRVWSHSTVFPATPVDMVDAGVDVISHAIYLYWAGIADPPMHYADRVPPRAAYDSVPVDGPVMRRLFATMKARGTVFDPTLSILLRLEHARAGASGLVDPGRAAQWAYDATRAARLAGAIVCAGTDGMMPGTPDSLPGLHGEMELLVTRAGFSPLEAITAATLNSARAIGVESRVGTIAPGKWADLVVLTADPTADIRNTRRIAFVVRGGVIHRRPSSNGP